MPKGSRNSDLPTRIETCEGSIDDIYPDGTVISSIYAPLDEHSRRSSAEYEFDSAILPEIERRKLGMYASFLCEVELSTDLQGFFLDNVQNIRFIKSKVLTKEMIEQAQKDFSFLNKLDGPE